MNKSVKGFRGFLTEILISSTYLLDYNQKFNRANRKFFISLYIHMYYIRYIQKSIELKTLHILFSMCVKLKYKM